MNKHRFKKRLKRIIAVISLTALINSSVLLFGSAEPASFEKNSNYEKTNIIDTISNGKTECGKLLYSAASKIYGMDENDGSVYPVKDGEGILVSTSDNAKTEIAGAEKYSISFDLKTIYDVDETAKLADFWLFTNETPVNPTSGAKENKGRLGVFSVYKNRVSLSGDGNEGERKNISITPEKWVNIEYVVYPQKEENDINKALWYVNGELVLEGRVKTQKENWRMSENRILNMMYGLGLKKDAFCLKNFKLCSIKSVEQNQTYSASAYIDENNNINGGFTDEVYSDSKLDAIKVYDNSGEEVSTVVALDESLKNITIVPEVKSDRYTVKFPERFISKSGLSLKDTTVNADGFEPIRLVDSDESDYSFGGETVYAKTKLLNVSDKDKNFLLMLAAYKTGTSGLEMIGCAEKSVVIPAHGITEVTPTNENRIEMTVPADAQIIKAFMWDAAENNAVLKEATELATGAYTQTFPENDGFAQSGASEISLAASFGEMYANAQASVYITDKDKNCVYADQLAADSSGRVGTFIKLSDEFETGECKVVVSVGKEHKEFSLAYINAKKYDDAAKSINSEIEKAEQSNEQTIENISKLLAENYSYLGIDDTLNSYITSSDVALLLYNELSKDENSKLPLFEIGSFENMEKGSKEVKRAYIMIACGNGKITNLFDCTGEFELEKDENYEWYIKEYVTESVKADITSRMSKENLNTANYETTEQFYNRLKDSYILTIVKAPNGEDNLRDVLAHYASYIGIKDTLKSSTLTSLKGMDIKNIGGTYGLKSVIEGLETKDSNNSSSGNIGGGTRTGGSTGKSSSVKFDDTIAKNDEPQLIPNDIYNDLDGYEWAKQAIVYLTEKRIVNGKSENEFCPSDLITREEFAAMLVRAFAEDAEKTEVGFKDADSNEWYFEYLGKAKAAGFINGYEDGRFGIGENISRQDMVAMVSRAAKYAGIMLGSGGGYTPFDDDSNIADYAKSAVYEMKNAGIVNGVADRTFAPLDNAERAQAAKVIFELLNV